MKIDEQLSELEEMLIIMAKQVRSMMEQSMDALLHDKKDKALFIIESDAHINNLEQEINETSVHVLSLLQPVASDLRRVLTAIKIAKDLERIGDYAKNIARYVIKNQHLPELLWEETRHLFELFFTNYDKVIKVVQTNDIALAYETAEADEMIDETLKRVAMKVDFSNKEKVNVSFATISLLRNIERAGDHSKNICEHVIYRKKAQYVDFG